MLAAQGKSTSLKDCPELVAKPRSFTSNGKLTFNFSEEVIIPEELEEISLRTSALRLQADEDDARQLQKEGRVEGNLARFMEF